MQQAQRQQREKTNKTNEGKLKGSKMQQDHAKRKDKQNKTRKIKGSDAARSTPMSEANKENEQPKQKLRERRTQPHSRSSRVATIEAAPRNQQSPNTPWITSPASQEVEVRRQDNVDQSTTRS
jgi:hypothetical protein